MPTFEQFKRDLDAAIREDEGVKQWPRLKYPMGDLISVVSNGVRRTNIEPLSSMSLLRTYAEEARIFRNEQNVRRYMAEMYLAEEEFSEVRALEYKFHEDCKAYKRALPVFPSEKCYNKYDCSSDDPYFASEVNGGVSPQLPKPPDILHNAYLLQRFCESGNRYCGSPCVLCDNCFNQVTEASDPTDTFMVPTGYEGDVASTQCKQCVVYQEAPRSWYETSVPERHNLNVVG